MNNEPQIQDKPEIITNENHPTLPYSNHHFYEHRASKCALFGCGRDLGIQEMMVSKYCYRHRGEDVVQKVSPATLMRLKEIGGFTDFELKTKTI